jgi:hypothetical protein
VIEDQARLDTGEPPFAVDLDDLVHVLGEIEHDRLVAGLAGQARTGAACEHGCAVIAADRERRDDIVGVARNHDTDRQLPVVRRIGRIERAATLAEAHLAAHPDRQLPCKPPLVEHALLRTRRH